MGHATMPGFHGWRVQSDLVPDDDAFAALSSRSRTALHVIDEELPASERCLMRVVVLHWLMPVASLRASDGQRTRAGRGEYSRVL